MAVWTLARKEFLLLLRDRLAAILLLVLPFVCILILGLLLGEGFWQRPDERLRVSVCNLDEGPADFGVAQEAQAPTSDEVLAEAMAFLSATPGLGEPLGARTVSAAALAFYQWKPVSWAELVIKDLQETAGIRVELIPTREEAKRLCNSRQRAAVVVFGPEFSRQVTLSSFLNEGINPFYRDGVDLKLLTVDVVRDDTQLAAASIIDQATQVTMLRVILPYMIGRAFEKISEKEFIDLLGNRVRLPVPDNFAVQAMFRVYNIQLQDGKASLNDTLKVAASNDMAKVKEYQGKVGLGVQDALAVQFSKYNLTGKTWASLTRSAPRGGDDPLAPPPPEPEGGLGPLRRGALRYQILVPSYTVMFAYSLILTVGWLFVAERAQGTLRRLRAAPLTRTQILLGKVIPCFVLSLFQGMMLLGMGKLVFGMRWGPESWPLWQQVLWVLPVVATTSLSAVGLSLFVAALSRTPIQVAIVGSLLVMAFALVSGCLIPRNLMPDEMQALSLVTPHAWALQAYTELLIGQTPNLSLVLQSCGVLSVFGLGFLGVAWWIMPLD